MHPAQLALAAGVDLKWIQNARRLLGRTPRHDAREARWLALVHELHVTLGCSLAQAARVADRALATGPEQRDLRVALGTDERAELVVDLWRDSTLHLARLARALTMPPPERRGRPPSGGSPRGSVRTRARVYGIDVDRLRAARDRTPAERLARLDDNLAFLTEGRAALARRRAGA